MQKTPDNPRIVFFGTPHVAKETLKALYESGYTIDLVVTNPDKPVGRKHTMTASPVKLLAQSYNIPVLQPDAITPEVVTAISSYAPTVAIVVAYGMLLPQSLIDLPTHGTYNIHYSLLPRWRGAAPVEYALWHGDTETGVTLQKMVRKMDAGDIVAQQTVSIDHKDTADTLFAKLIPLGARVLLDTLPHILNSSITLTPQDEYHVTHAPKFVKEDGTLTSDMSEIQKWNTFRALAVRPGVFCTLKNGQIAKILEATYLDGSFVPITIVVPGKTPVSYTHYLATLQ